MIKPYRHLFLVSGICMTIYALAGILPPLVIRSIIDDVIPNKDSSAMVTALLILLGLLIVRLVFDVTAIRCMQYASQRTMLDFRTRLIRHVQSLPMKFHDNYQSGKLTASLISDVQKMQAMVSQSVNNLILNGLTILGSLTMMLILEWRLGLVIFFLFPIYAFTFFTVKTKAKKIQIKTSKLLAEVAGNISEVIRGIKVVKSLGRERYESRRFMGLFRGILTQHLKTVGLNIRCGVIAQSLGTIMTCAMLGLGSVLIWEGKTTLGSFVAFLSYLNMLLGPMQVITNFSPTLADGLAGFSRIKELLNEDSEPEGGSLLLTPGETGGEIHFDNLTFRYEGLRPTTVMKNFNLHIKPGETVALVGPSGSGKSTLGNLLLRYYDVSSGQITIDGMPLNRIRSRSLRQSIGVVLQEPTLFAGTVAENISYGNPGIHPSKIEEVAKMAQAHDFIMELPGGYSSMIGENGVSLSGGQKQRVAIARTLLMNPPILLLDEATSALDNRSEREVQRALNKVMAGRTTLIIAHRLGTVRHADRIVVLDKGQISEMGSHQELKNRDGLYAKLLKEEAREHIEESSRRLQRA
jgi:ATP-binding cassette, subfamily B, bacterial MsbA